MRRFFRILFFAFAVGASSVAHAEDWPTRPIKLIVPTGPGHAVDFMARAITAGVSKELGQTMFVDNMPGAAGAVGAHAAAKAAPDGYTFLFAFASLLSSNIYLYKSLPYDPRHDFTAVAMVCDKGPMVVSVNPQLPVKTIPELISYGEAHPGTLSYGVDASGGLAIVAGRLLNKRGHIGMIEVPYRSSPQMVEDTVAGRVQLSVGSIPAVAGAQKAGQVRWIGISSAQRFPGLPNLPTIAETLPGFRIDGWFAVVAPTGTPAPILERLDHAIDGVLKDPGLRKRMLAFGLGLSDAGTPASTQAFIKSEQDRWGELVQELGMQPQ